MPSLSNFDSNRSLPEIQLTDQSMNLGNDFQFTFTIPKFEKSYSIEIDT